jgi:Notch-like protein
MASDLHCYILPLILLLTQVAAQSEQVLLSHTVSVDSSLIPALFSHNSKLHAAASASVANVVAELTGVEVDVALALPRTARRRLQGADLAIHYAVLCGSQCGSVENNLAAMTPADGQSGDQSAALDFASSIIGAINDAAADVGMAPPVLSNPNDVVANLDPPQVAVVVIQQPPKDCFGLPIINSYRGSYDKCGVCQYPDTKAVPNPNINSLFPDGSPCNLCGGSFSMCDGRFDTTTGMNRSTCIFRDPVCPPEFKILGPSGSPLVNSSCTPQHECICSLGYEETQEPIETTVAGVNFTTGYTAQNQMCTNIDGRVFNNASGLVGIQVPCSPYSQCYDSLPPLMGNTCGDCGSIAGVDSSAFFRIGQVGDRTGFHCHDLDECVSNPCPSATSVCWDSSTNWTAPYAANTWGVAPNAFFCECFPGWTGQLCDQGNLCLGALNGHDCDVNAECTHLGHLLHSCQCRVGWQTPAGERNGTRCVDIDECLSAPCQNGATCYDSTTSAVAVNLYHCLCVPGYSGVHCTVDRNECLSRPCLNGATCADSSFSATVPVDAYSCNCVRGWTGVICNVDVNECASNPCRSGSTCEDSSGGRVAINAFMCVCPGGFAGITCSIDIDECASSPCLHGASCADSTTSTLVRPDNFVCTCTTGWTGVVCSVDIDELPRPHAKMVQHAHSRVPTGPSASTTTPANVRLATQISTVPPTSTNVPLAPA